MLLSSLLPADDFGVQVVLLEQQEVLQPVGQLERHQTAAAQVFPDHHSAQVRQRARVTWITENSRFYSDKHVYMSTNKNRSRVSPVVLRM